MRPLSKLDYFQPVEEFILPPRSERPSSHRGVFITVENYGCTYNCIVVLEYSNEVDKRSIVHLYIETAHGPADQKQKDSFSVPVMNNQPHYPILYKRNDVLLNDVLLEEEASRALSSMQIAIDRVQARWCRTPPSSSQKPNVLEVCNDTGEIPPEFNVPKKSCLSPPKKPMGKKSRAQRAAETTENVLAATVATIAIETMCAPCRKPTQKKLLMVEQKILQRVQSVLDRASNLLTDIEKSVQYTGEDKLFPLSTRAEAMIAEITTLIASPILTEKEDTLARRLQDVYLSVTAQLQCINGKLQAQREQSVRDKRRNRHHQSEAVILTPPSAQVLAAAEAAPGQVPELEPGQEQTQDTDSTELLPGEIYKPELTTKGLAYLLLGNAVWSAVPPLDEVFGSAIKRSGYSSDSKLLSNGPTKPNRGLS